MIGLEPITCWLQISCSANWATSAHSLISLSRVTPTGIEPVLPPWKGDVLTAWPWSQLFKTPQVGLEPTTLRLTAECSTDWAIEDYLRFYIPSKLHTFPQGSSSCFARCDEQQKNNLLFSNSTIILIVFWLSLRPISNSQLHVLPHFHLCPIYLIVSQGSYLLIGGEISSWGGLHA